MDSSDPNWVNHCLSLIIEREARDVASFRERELVKAMALFPEILNENENSGSKSPASEHS